MVIEQIEKAHKELGHGRMNITLKAGNIPDELVSRSMNYLKETVFPAVKKFREELDLLQLKQLSDKIDYTS